MQATLKCKYFGFSFAKRSLHFFVGNYILNYIVSRPKLAPFVIQALAQVSFLLRYKLPSNQVKNIDVKCLISLNKPCICVGRIAFLYQDFMNMFENIPYRFWKSGT